MNKIVKQQSINGICPIYGIYKVNNYDLRILKTEAKELAVQQYGITRVKTDTLCSGNIRSKCAERLRSDFILGIIPKHEE